MKKGLFFAGLLLLSVALIITNPIKADDKNKEHNLKKQVAYVNMQQLFQGHPQKELSEGELEKQAKKLKKELESKGKTMDKEERQELLQQYQTQLNQQEQELIAGVVDDINQKISEVAEEQDVAVVLDKSAVIYGGYNLTPAVLEEISDSKTATAEDETEPNN
ncbi:MAG: OmpH family outer membrane protein [Bacillota bacterium]